METFKKRLKALDALIAQDGIILTENQIAALERKKVEQEVKGEIEIYHPGYLGAQYTYSKTAHLKLYDRKNAL